MIKKGDKVAVGFSGGADSTALLHALYLLKDELGFSLCAAHINHGIRGKEAERDENFARDFCKNKDIPFFCLHADVPSLARMRKLCLEDAGRQVRYEFFEKCAAGGKIATAHTPVGQRRDNGHAAVPPARVLKACAEFLPSGITLSVRS